uniref:Uncharacterized protein n=1 Tax=Arundo donax TaxID=35708 RepID=A0A0A9FC83_ARUDO
MELIIYLCTFSKYAVGHMFYTIIGRC